MSRLWCDRMREISTVGVKAWGINKVSRIWRESGAFQIRDSHAKCVSPDRSV